MNRKWFEHAAGITLATMCVLGLMVTQAFSQPLLQSGEKCNTTAWQVDATNATRTEVVCSDYLGTLFFPVNLTVTLDSDASGPVTIRRYVATNHTSGVTIITSLVAIDAASVIVIQPGGSYTCSYPGISAISWVKTTGSDGIRWETNNCATPSSLLGSTGTPLLVASALNTSVDSLVVLATDEETEWVTLCTGATIPTAGPQTFPIPLCPTGGHETVTFSITIAGTLPDSLYYQFVAASTPTDSLTVLNIGTIAVPVLTGILDYPIDNSKFHSRGVEIAAGVNLEKMTNAKFIGIRLRSSAGGDATLVKVVAGLK